MAMHSFSHRLQPSRGAPVWLSLASFGAGLLLAGAVSAEGALRFFDCDIERVCDGAGMCESGSGAITFQMEPVALQVDGSGEYTMSYGEVNAPMQAFSEAGPFVWTVDGERHALLVSSDAQFLWHTLALEEAPEARVTFLSCSLRY